MGQTLENEIEEKKQVKDLNIGVRVLELVVKI